MKSLQSLLERLDYTWVQGETDSYMVSELVHDNRKATDHCLFVCIKGARFNTHEKIDEIYEQCGSAVFVISEDVQTTNPNIPLIRVKDSRLASAYLAAAWYGYPAEQFKLIVGITGSKGKTTVTHMLADIMRCDGMKVGTIGTNGAIIGDEIHELANTTPDAMEVQMYLRMMVDAGCDGAVVECSSQGLMQHRVSAITFDYGVFTNISRGDHVGPNEHESFEEYMYCKGLLLAQSKCAVVFGEDENLEGVMKEVPKHIPVVTYGRTEAMQYFAHDVRRTFTYEDGSVAEYNGTPGLEFKVGGKHELEIAVNLPGEFNVTNALAATVVAKEAGLADTSVCEALNHMAIKGRLDMVFRNNKFSVCVDFAHNGYSTRNLLEALREYRPKRLVCVFGADGNRAKSRRYEMGEASGRLADLSIVTSGHNRYETFDQILKDIMVGLEPTKGAYLVIPDRKEAIRYAIGHAEDGDVITIIGLGHESYQEEGGHKYPYSDTEFVKTVVREMGYCD